MILLFLAPTKQTAPATAGDSDGRSHQYPEPDPSGGIRKQDQLWALGQEHGPLNGLGGQAQMPFFFTRQLLRHSNN